ncbi:MAG TPA: hypothetical protein VNU68_29180 [Verrucomicrobiae bacterium]|nr:hypothetical protein [Verrucomicrobiae bacterium]
MNADGIKPRGNYDDEAERQLVELGAELVVLIVINGNKGNGFSVCGIDGHKDSKLPKLPFILRDMANSIEAQQKLQKNQ